MSNGSDGCLEKAIADISVEVFRFGRVFERAMMRLDAGDYEKYMSQFSWFAKRVDQAIAEAGLRIVNLEGMPYDPGMPAMPLNLEDFDAGDHLFVAQMVEPVLMKGDALMHTGTVYLGRAEA